MSRYDLDLTWTDPATGKATHVAGQLDVETTETPTERVPPTIVSGSEPMTVTAGQRATLTVVAEGTAPLDYQWAADGVPVPSAGGATYLTPPLTATTDYAVEVSNAVGTVTSNAVTVTVLPATPTVGLGLEFVRTIGLPPMYMAYTYGDLTGRIVDGKVRLLFTGDWVNVCAPVYEVEVTDASVATFIKEWPDPYHGKRGTWMTGQSLRDSADELERYAEERHLPWLLALAARYRRIAKTVAPHEWYWLDFATSGTAALNNGHYYHPTLDLLYITYADSYNVAGRPDWQCLALRLHDDGTTDAYGPWRIAGQDGEGTPRVGPRAAMTLRAHPTLGTMLVCAGLTSGNAGCAWGCNLLGGAPWPTETTPVGPTAPDVFNDDCYLYGYYMGQSINAVTGVATGPVRSMRRPLHPYVHERFENNNQLNFVDPAAYEGIGSWTDNDVLAGLLPLPDRTYFFGGVAGSPIQDPMDPLAAHVFYANGANAFKCSHGFDAVPAGITGPTATARFPFACVYDNAALAAGLAAPATNWQTEPTSWANLEQEFGIVTAPIDSVGDAKTISGGFFDERTRLLYLMAHGADRGTVTWGLINAAVHVFKVD